MVVKKIMCVVTVAEQAILLYHVTLKYIFIFNRVALIGVQHRILYVYYWKQLNVI